MQMAGELLLSQVVQAVVSLVPSLNLSELRTKLSEAISRFDVRRVEQHEPHPDLTEKIELFLAGKKLEGLSILTLSDYRRHLERFAEEIKKKVEDVTTADIRVYMGRYNHLKLSTISTKISVLKSFFGWLTAEELLPRDPTARIKPPKKEKRLPKALSIEELELLRESCADHRQRALIEVMYATGCRLSEMYGMDQVDINQATQGCRVIGKGNKEREVFLSFKAMFHLKKYLASRNDDDPALFVTERRPHRRLSRRGIQLEIGKIATAAGLQKRVTPHTLRHTFATLTLNNGADLVVVQQLLGHENPATTQIYATLSPERKREQYKKHLVQ